MTSKSLGQRELHHRMCFIACSAMDLEEWGAMQRGGVKLDGSAAPVFNVRGDREKHVEPKEVLEGGWNSARLRAKPKNSNIWAA